MGAAMISACGSPQKETAEPSPLEVTGTSLAQSTESLKAGDSRQRFPGEGESEEGGAWLEDVYPEDEDEIRPYGEETDSGTGYGALKDDYILPDSDKRFIGREELWNLDKAALRLAKNEIYARHGLIFQEEDLREYFNSKSWYYGYIPAEEFDENLYLSEEERDTVYMISLMEEEIGPSYGSMEFGSDLPWIGVYFSEDEQVISVVDVLDDGVEISFSGYTEEGDYTYRTVFPYVGEDKTQVVDNGNYPLQQTVFTLKEDGILVEVLPDGGWAAGFYTRQ